jgi:hypothetical protein
VTRAQADAIVATLRAAWPTSRKGSTPETGQLFAELLLPLDHDVAAAAVRRLIAGSRFFPAFADLRRAYDVEAAAARRRQLAAETRELLAEPSDEERSAQLAAMREFVAARWGTP